MTALRAPPRRLSAEGWPGRSSPVSAYVADRVFQARVTPHMHPGTGGGACVVALDVTRHHASQMRAFRKDRMGALGTLAAGVASEINNPLTYVLINIEHVMRRLRALGALDEGERPLWPELSTALASLVDALSKSYEGANRVRAVTRDILVFSQGNDDSRGLIDVRAVLESSLQLAWHELRPRAKVIKHFAEVPPLDANATQLAQVFLQLFVNAATAIPEGNAEHEEVRVSTRCDPDGDVVVEIGDTGAGITPEALPHVFDPFFTTRGVGEGMGLGLSICHGIVTQMGGRISAESAPGRGSVFRVVLPATKRAPGGSVRPPGGPRCRVLVVDADPLIGEAIGRSLGDASVLTVASDARRALELIAGADFDVVLCDVMLPEATGVEFYVEMLRAAPHLVRRIVFMVGGASTVRARAFLSSIANPRLVKPIDMGELRRLVEHSATFK